MWAGLYTAGVHPTLAGVVLGLWTPVRPWFGASRFAETTRAHLGDLTEGDDRQAVMVKLVEIERARREAVSPAERLIYALHPWVAFGIMPLFALANAGVPLGAADLGGDAGRIFAGIVIGIVVGKPLGIFAASAIATRAGWRRGPPTSPTPGSRWSAWSAASASPCRCSSPRSPSRPDRCSTPPSWPSWSARRSRSSPA